MNAIEDNAYRQSWQALGGQFGDHDGARWRAPSAIMCVSAHWLTRGTWMTSAPQPKTIHDFGGFPAELFAQQYPAPGAPALLDRVRALLAPGVPIHADDGQWGFDHGAWSVLKPMFPQAQIPLVQLSIDAQLPAAQMLAIGRGLLPLRDEGVLIVASGNVVHNLRAMREGAAYDWNTTFDQFVADAIAARDLTAIAHFETHPHAKNAHPSTEHFLPLLYAAGASLPSDAISFFNENAALGGIAMRSIIWAPS